MKKLKIELKVNDFYDYGNCKSLKRLLKDLLSIRGEFETQEEIDEFVEKNHIVKIVDIEVIKPINFHSGCEYNYGYKLVCCDENFKITSNELAFIYSENKIINLIHNKELVKVENYKLLLENGMVVEFYNGGKAVFLNGHFYNDDFMSHISLKDYNNLLEIVTMNSMFEKVGQLAFRINKIYKIDYNDMFMCFAPIELTYKALLVFDREINETYYNKIKNDF